MIYSSLIAALLAGFAQANDAGRHSGDSVNPVIPALVKVADDMKLPAKEPGVLVHLAVQDGSLIRAGQVLGNVDDSEPRMQKKAASAGYAAAYKRAIDNVEIEYSEAAAKVAKVDYEMIVESNRLVEKAVTLVEERRAKLEWDKLLLSIKKARHEKEIAEFEAYTKKAEVEAADLAIGRRVLTAPFDGVVEKLYRKQDEWVNPGDIIARLFRLDTMEVEGAVEQSKYDPQELQGCEVTVEVQMARGRKETIRGRIKFVSSIVQQHGVFNVRAEVANRQEHGSWMLRDGLPATMTIHLGTGGTAAAADVSRAP